ncbi:MAG: HAD family phosphatase [Anaerolineales bacterium]
MFAHSPTAARLPAFVFDLGGVLLDWNPRRLFREFFDGDPAALETFLAEIDFPAWNAELDRGRPIAEAVADLSRRFPHYAAPLQAYHLRWEETVLGPIQPVVGLLARLKQAGRPLFALSNWSAETFALVRARYDFLGWFDRLVISGEIGLIKPEEAVFRTFLDLIGRRPGECLFIDDSQANIAAAARLGFQTIHFLSPEQLNAELAARALLPPA